MIGRRRPRISLCMIVRNEAQNLPGCLAPVHDLVDEIIVVDTGSTDRTPEIAREWGAQVFDFCWIDDFSAARNESLRHATGDYILWLDADDRLDSENVRRLESLLDSLTDSRRAYVFRTVCESRLRHRRGGRDYPPKIVPGSRPTPVAVSRSRTDHVQPGATRIRNTLVRRQHSASGL